MSTQITTPMVSAYKSSVEMLLQQKGSVLRNAVRLESFTGEDCYFEQLGLATAVQRTSRHADTPRIDIPHARRKVIPKDYETADLIDQQDRLRLLAEFQNPYAQAQAMALGRSMDDDIIKAALGDALTGHTGSTTVGIGASNQIAVNFGGTNIGLTIGKLIRAKYILDANDNGFDEPRYIACHPQQISELLATTQITSSDYNSVKALVQGQVDTFMGFKFIVSTRFAALSETYNAATDIYQIFAWRKNGLLLAVNNDITVKISERDDKSYATQVYSKGTWGATRMQEGSVVQISCDASP